MTLAKTLPAIALCFAGCASSPPPVAQTSAEPLIIQPEPHATHEPPHQYESNPVLTMEVFGPDSLAPIVSSNPDADTFIASVRVTNTGAAPTVVEAARVTFAAFRGSDRVTCQPAPEQPEGPPVLNPGASFEFRGRVHCDLSRPGRYEIQAYVSFGATHGASFDLRREYAGRYWVIVGPNGPTDASGAGPVL